MYFFKKVLLSYKFIILLLFLLALGAAIATFIENDYDAQTAKVLVYNAVWYESIMVLLAISLIGIIIKQKMYKKMGAFLFHLGFVFVLIGAGVTRYFGYEGVIHIREHTAENRVISEKSYFQIKVNNKTFSHPLSLGKIGDNSFEYLYKINNKNLKIKFKDYKTHKNTNVENLFVIASYDNKKEELKINGGHGNLEPPTIFSVDGMNIELSWGSKIIRLPFKIELRDFQIERYPGSQSPSSYASEVSLIDKNSSFNYRIFMNNPLSYKGFKFFQSSYDKDEMGTVLSVNKDPGKWPTYFAYFLLSLGFILNFFTKKSRFERLRIFLIKNNLCLILPIIFIFSSIVKADNVQYLNDFRQNTNEHAKSFAQIYVQDFNGRIKPMGTQSLEVLHKMSLKDSMFGLSATQVMLGIFSEPTRWERMNLIRIKNSKIKKILKIKKDIKYISFSSVFTPDGEYKLDKYINDANEKMPSKRGTFDKDLIKLDERLNIYYLSTIGIFSKFIPNASDNSHKWYSPQEAITKYWLDDKIRSTLYKYKNALIKGIFKNDWKQADESLSILKKYQREQDSEILPSFYQTKVELLSNKLEIFPNLIKVYFLIGFIALVFSIISIFLKKDFPRFKKIFFTLLFVGFVFHTLGLAMRWYISGHAPWSNTYESLIYIGWSSILAGLVVFRKSLLSLACSSIFGAITMLVAHLNFISPQITPLVPVLKSYWLSIHVSIITASYGFLGFGAILSFLALLLMIFKSTKNKKDIDLQIRQLAAITEISLIVGISLLTVGNFVGGIWANESWGRYWGWDPKETWSFISIVIYTIVLHLRFIPKMNKVYVFLIASVLSFFSIIMTYFGVNFYLSGMHSYASGDKVPIPSFVYYIVAIVFVVILLAFPKRDVKVIK
ncbi:cytochrome c biogenesis protein CcsA [Arcobacter sp. CECT 8985]|uniref:cytochrome c biogenesis protein CcsA n=1 Tax=Arcobacter sp. CECT 8985 TaxID=1935424 RepID=UPI00100ACA41|nr:cytochrome c biogenesis protein CcsA [Arcobacter sp. CECT 8985]RXJ87139.1 NAD(FAD)-utilizing dehydrogenase [Arcobacter sp. CECT 8985]